MALLPLQQGCGNVCRFLWFLATVDQICLIGGAPSTVRITSDSPSYFRLRIPEGRTALHIYAESDRPVALMAAFGYFPTEAHYDVSNFPDWAAGHTSTSVHVPVALRQSPCNDGPFKSTMSPPVLTCLTQGVSSGNLLCGTAPQKQPQENLASTSSVRNLRQRGLCQKYVDGCVESVCSPRRGPTRCNVTDHATGDGNCFCQQGYCEVSRQCVDADLVQPGCTKVTGQGCPSRTCPSSLGLARCEDGLCVCQPGHCAVNGVCQPGPMCAELSHPGNCHSVPPNKDNGKIPQAWVGAKANIDHCCQLLDTARAVSPGSFARCAARHFFGLKHATASGIHVPLLRMPAKVVATPGMQEGLQLEDDLVLSLRSAELSSGTSKVLVRLLVMEDQEPSISIAGAFNTIQQLVSPAWGQESKQRPSWQQLEAPLLKPFSGPNAVPTQAPAGAAWFELVKGETVLLRLPEEDFTGMGAGQVSSASGTLQLHVIGLPPGSTVLYSRSWPEPRSPMDFAHAWSVATLPQSGASAWRAAHLSARHFALLPAANGRAAAFFSVSPSWEPTIPQPREAPRSSRTSAPSKDSSANSKIQVLAGLLATAVLSIAIYCSHTKLWLVNGRYQAAAASMYSAVPSSDLEAHKAPVAHTPSLRVTSGPNGQGSSDNEVELPEVLTSFRTFTEIVKDRLSHRGSNIMSGSTRASTNGGTRRSCFEEDEAECRALSPERLSWLLDTSNGDDQEAMAAMLSLRPSLRDSLGDEADTSESDTPVVGTERASLLLRT